MIKYPGILFVIFIFINCIPYLQPPKPEPQVRVAIVIGVDSIIVSGIKEDKHLKEYKIKTTDSLPIILRPYGGSVMVNGRPYQGWIEIKKIKNKIWVLNIIDIESYLKGVVPMELGRIDGKIIEAAKAQAVAARTYAYAHLGQYPELGFDLYGTVKDQVYGGIAVEDSLINRAIRETRGLVLTYRGKPIDAKFHSTCGGHTADFNDAWPGNAPPYLKSIPCNFCIQSPHFRWKKVITRDEFFRHLKKNLQNLGIAILDTELIVSLKLKRNPRSQRVTEMKIVTTRNEYKIFAHQIRKLLGSEKDPGGLLKSNCFEIYLKNGAVVIEGKGYGHGVGMCQYGILAMAQKKKKFGEMLKYYYPGARLSRLW